MSGAGPERQESFGFLEGLPFRVVAFLSLALLPIGLLAMWQTKNLDDNLRARTELSLVALTELAASGERRALQNAIGSAQSEAAMLPRDLMDEGTCRTMFTNLVDISPNYSFVGFVPLEGDITCSSADRPIEVETIDSRILGLRDSSERSFLRADSQLMPGVEVAVLLYPVIPDEDVIGQIAVAIPLAELEAERDMDLDRAPLSMVIYNRDGDLVMSQGEALSTATLDMLARRVTPETTFSSQRRVLRGTNADGQERLLTTSTVVPGLAYAVASWPPLGGALGGDRTALPSTFLPVLMWFASLFVAYFAVHRLVVGPIKDLRRRMREFAADRSLKESKSAVQLPRELYELDRTFVDMAYDLLDDEARMEDALREKNLLLKEIHHRVKNNLQMISSIINMQIRATGESTAKETLIRLHARVLNLATVHRFLYQADDFGRIDICSLVEDLCGSLFDSLRADFPQAQTHVACDDFGLVPDQAIPLALFIGEVVSQVHRSQPKDSHDLSMAVDLRTIEDGVARLQIVSPYRSEDDGSVDADINRQLKRAFALQLGSTIERSTTDDGQRLIGLTFEITSALPETKDY
ncbi:sensor histidine kinase [Salipiger sp. IMCC34102]|uniref:sensor histidine kinase n=1 Tax=Salipiger sp. IMCC34102 TaxID=2510647 RepID=UPI00101E14F7|nr:sensor histidine kinase [Salipiger sp. IMCC34102]RYH03908.1 sensor histidine kinase [Salipiger sp. IMCC34102]